MIAALSRLLAQRSVRERVLVAVLVLVALPAAALFLGVLPLLDQRDAARAALAAAQAERAWYIEQQAEMAALPVSGETAPQPTTAPVGLAGIEARLIEAELRDAVTQLANAPDGVVLSFEAVGFEGLMGWLGAVETEAGYRAASLQVRRGETPGMVGADLLLEPMP